MVEVMSIDEINLVANSRYSISLPTELSNGKFDDREYYLCNEHFIITTDDEGLWRIWDMDALKYVSSTTTSLEEAIEIVEQETERQIGLAYSFWGGDTKLGVHLLNDRQLSSMKYKLTKREKDMIIDRTPTTPYADEWIPLRLREDKGQYLMGKLPCPTCSFREFTSLTAAERHHFYCKEYGFQPSNGLYFTPIQKMMLKANLLKGAETFEAPMKGAQPPRRSQDDGGVYLTREHTKAIKTALESQFPDTNWKVKKQGNSAVQFFGYSSPNENDPKRLEIDNIILKAIKNIENDDYGWEEGDDLGITIYDESTFMRFYEAESTKPHSVTISRSSNSEKKLMAVFEDGEGKKIKTTHFGQRGADDYTKHDKDIRDERKKLYLERHGGGFETSTKEDWKDPTTAGSLSRWILWNEPSLNSSFNDYKRKFGLKGDLKVSKSAESNETKGLIFIPLLIIVGCLIPYFLDSREYKV